MESKSEEKRTKVISGDCSLCNQHEAKYRCPRCDVMTCSALCVTRHKKENDCSGLRNKTAYIPMKKYKEFNFLSDYRFLEDVARKADTVSRMNFPSDRNLQERLAKVRKAASKRGIQFKTLPKVFKRHMKNTTHVNNRDIIFWRIEWMFPLSNYTTLEHGVSEDRNLGDAVERFIDPEVANPIKLQMLKTYTKIDQSKIKVLIPAKKVPERPGKWYHELDKEVTIRENLNGRFIFEFPTFVVVTEEMLDVYKIAPKEEEKKPEEPPEEVTVGTKRPKYRRFGANRDEGESPVKKKKLEENKDGKDGDVKKDGDVTKDENNEQTEGGMVFGDKGKDSNTCKDGDGSKDGDSKQDGSQSKEDDIKESKKGNKAEDKKD